MSTASKVEYHGRSPGLGAGTGAAFALLPAQNATGNWIKVVQRVPVRIALDPKQLAAHPLRVGLSMEVTGRRARPERKGAPIARDRPAPVAAFDARCSSRMQADADDRRRIIAAAGAPARGPAGRAAAKRLPRSAHSTRRRAPPRPAAGRCRADARRRCTGRTLVLGTLRCRWPRS
jgi:membrane fusion protein (multidrug efflux system)